VPIIPVYVEGGFAAWPVGRKYPRRGTITVRFGSPLLPSTLAARMTGRVRDEKIAAGVEAAVAALA